MSSKESEPPLRIEPRSSRQLAIALLLLHGAAMLAVVNLALPAGMILALAGSIVMSLYLTFNSQVLGRGARALCVLVWEGDGDWTLVSGRGQRWRGRLRAGSYAHPRLVILNFAVDGQGGRSLVLLPDSLDRHTFRRLLVRLRLQTRDEQPRK